MSNAWAITVVLVFSCAVPLAESFQRRMDQETTEAAEGTMVRGAETVAEGTLDNSYHKHNPCYQYRECHNPEADYGSQATMSAALDECHKEATACNKKLYKDCPEGKVKDCAWCLGFGDDIMQKCQFEQKKVKNCVEGLDCEGCPGYRPLSTNILGTDNAFTKCYQKQCDEAIDCTNCSTENKLTCHLKFHQKQCDEAIDCTHCCKCAKLTCEAAQQKKNAAQQKKNCDEAIDCTHCLKENKLTCENAKVAHQKKMYQKMQAMDKIVVPEQAA